MNISQHISEIERSIELQQDNIRRLIDENSHKEQRRNFLPLENLLNLILDIQINYAHQKKLIKIKLLFLLAGGFVLGIFMTAVLIFMLIF